MADRTALTAGIAAASIAAVVAATPALITPPNNDVQVTAAAVAAKQVSTDVQLVAFSLTVLFDAFIEGYYQEDFSGGLVDDDLAAAVANGSVAAAIAAGVVTSKAEYRELIVADYTLPGFSGAIYYTLDELLPPTVFYDDAFAVLGVKGLLQLIAEDLDIDESPLVKFIFDPTTVLPEGVADLLANPALTALALAGAPDLALYFAQAPVDTVFAVLDLHPNLEGFIRNPIGTVLGGLIPAQQALTTFGETAPTDKVAPKLFNLDVSKPKVEPVAVDSVIAGDDITDGEEIPGEVVEGKAAEPEKPKPGDLVKNFNKELGNAATAISNGLKDLDAKAKAAKEARAEARAEAKAAKAEAKEAAKAAKAEAKEKAEDKKAEEKKPEPSESPAT